MADAVKVASLRAQLTDAMNETVKRVRANVKGPFGDDSSEYEMVGLSERNRPTTKMLGGDADVLT
mgnify:CR=1 FL=1